MPEKKNRKSKALKDKIQNNFLRALIFGIGTCIAVRLLLSLAVAFLLLLLDDAGALVDVISTVISALSLILAGVAVGFFEKKKPYFAAFVTGGTVLAVSFCLTSLFGLSRQCSNVEKTVIIVCSFLLPVVGAWFTTRNHPKRVRRRKRM